MLWSRQLANWARSESGLSMLTWSSTGTLSLAISYTIKKEQNILINWHSNIARLLVPLHSYIFVLELKQGRYL